MLKGILWFVGRKYYLKKIFCVSEKRANVSKNFFNKIIKCLFIAKFLLLNIMTDGREEIIYDLSSFL